MLLKNKQTGKITEVLDGVKFPENAFEIVKPATGKKLATQKPEEPKKPEGEKSAETKPKTEKTEEKTEKPAAPKEKSAKK